MSLDKAILHGKEKRKPYYSSQKCGCFSCEYSSYRPCPIVLKYKRTKEQVKRNDSRDIQAGA